MIVGAFEQRIPYKETPQRPWIRLRLEALDGSVVELELLADTGNPCVLIIASQSMARLKVGDAPHIQSNFGSLQGGWLQLAMPELGLVQAIPGYASDAVAAVRKASHVDRPDCPCFDFLNTAGMPIGSGWVRRRLLPNSASTFHWETPIR